MWVSNRPQFSFAIACPDWIVVSSPILTLPGQRGLTRLAVPPGFYATSPRPRYFPNRPRSSAGFDASQVLLVTPSFAGRLLLMLGRRWTTTSGIRTLSRRTLPSASSPPSRLGWSGHDCTSRRPDRQEAPRCDRSRYAHGLPA